MIEILALIVASLVAVYTIYDRHQVRQSQKRTEESQKRLEKRLDSPKVVAFLRRDEVNTSLLIVCVENVGTGTAKNVQFQPSNPSLETISGISLGDIGFIKNGIDYFGSGQKYEFPINTIRGEEAWKELMQTPLEITITYENSADEELVEDAHLDFGAFEKLPLVKSLIGAIAGTAEEMVNVTKDMVKATQKIGRELNQYTDLRAGDKVRTLDEFKEAMIDGYDRQRTTIPKGAICTVLEVTQEEITIEWDHASDEEGGRVIHRGLRTAGRGRHNQNPHMGRVIHRGQRQLSRRKLEREKIKLPPKQ